MSDKKLFKKQNDTNLSAKTVKTTPNTIGANKSEKTKSQSVNKYTMSIDKEQILKEFYLYKLNSTNSAYKYNKISKLNKSFSKSSKSGTSRGNLLIQVRSVKGVKQQNEDNLSYKTKKNIQNINKLENFNYNELCRKIQDNRVGNPNKKEENTRNIKLLEKNSKRQLRNVVTNQVDTMNPFIKLPGNKYKLIQIKNNFEVDKIQFHGKKINHLKGNYKDNSNGYLNISNQSGNSKSNFEKYQSYLNEKISYLKNSIEDNKVERDHLVSILNENKVNDKTIYEERLKSEINNYLKMKQNFIVTASQLTEEIDEIKTEIAKYSSSSTNFSTFYGFPHTIANGTAKENKNQNFYFDSHINPI